MQHCRTKSVTLILGGVRSGKSRFALNLAAKCPRVTFIATAEAREDREMQRKIDRHRAERPKHWQTLEVPLHVPDAIQASSPDSDSIVVDCLTIFAANLLEAHGEDARRDAEIARLCDSLTRVECAVILVSNEVGSGVVPAYSSGRRFRDLVGEVNQRVAAVADNVLMMVAGLPVELKGSTAPEAPQ